MKKMAIRETMQRLRRPRRIEWAIFVTVALFLLSFQNCGLNGLSSAPKDVNVSSSVDPGVYGVSPTSVQLSWAGITTATSYQVFDLAQGTTPIFNTTFTVASIPKLTPNSHYTFSVRGARGTGNYLSDPLGTWSFQTWPDFSSVTFTQTVQPDASTIISWKYSPWMDTLPASNDANQGSNISCSFLPVPAGTDPTSVDPTKPLNGKTPIVITNPLFGQQLAVSLGLVDASQYYAVQCAAEFVDGTASASTQKFLLGPSHILAACPASALVGKSYLCSPNVSAVSGQSQLGPFTIVLDASNTCQWASVSGTDIQSTGTLTAAAIGTCTLAYRYALTNSSYSSPAISQTVTVSVPQAFDVFPSFAVRALSGAVAFPHLHSLLSSGGMTDTRAMIKGDVISDFGYGSSFFAGGNAPFPVLNPAAPSLGSTFFYGFPVSAIVGGTRPNGFSLDALRPNWQSTTPASEGFIRGNLVIPNAQITNSNFLTATGSSAGPTLYSFLTNTYTFDGGSNYAPQSLSYYLNTIADRDAGGNPTSNPWNGTVFQRNTVQFNLPTAVYLQSLVPPTGVDGQTSFIANADPTKQVKGLIASPANNSIYYATNCQASPDTYSNPSGCTGQPTSISCFGDVIVQAPLLLVNATITTDANGCRIYATGTVYVQGTISAFTASGQPAPVQIASSRAIVLGFSEQSLGVTNSGARSTSGTGLMDQSFANGTTNPFLTSANNGPGAASAALNSIAMDAMVVGLKSNDGADPLASGATPFNYLALAAPYVFSNYSGLFTGSVIAEVALFPELNFTSDVRFHGMTPFPLLSGSNAPLTVSGQ